MFRDEKSLLPLSIKQLTTFTLNVNGKSFIDGVQLWLVSIIGHIKITEEDATSLSFVVNDGSSSIEAVFWKDSSEKHNWATCVRGGAFFKIIGELRDDDERKRLQVHHVSPLTDGNELTYHLMEIVYTHINNKDKH